MTVLEAFKITGLNCFCRRNLKGMLMYYKDYLCAAMSMLGLSCTLRNPSKRGRVSFFFGTVLCRRLQKLYHCGVCNNGNFKNSKTSSSRQKREAYSSSQKETTRLRSEVKTVFPNSHSSSAIEHRNYIKNQLKKYNGQSTFETR